MKSPVNPSRRRFLKGAAAMVAAGASRPLWIQAQSGSRDNGVVVGEAAAGRAGAQVLAEGGNVFDAVVAGAFVAAVAAPHQTGIAGYGGSATLAKAGEISSVDFNTAAPLACRPDQFQGPAAARTQEFGWLASGVPGVVAGLDLIRRKFGTWPLARVLAPALALARDGFTVTTAFAEIIGRAAAQFARDEGSRRLYLPGGKPPQPGDRFRNPELAEVLATLSQRGSVDSFYRGDIASQIADAFRRNDGLVTARDLAVYEARLVKPLRLAQHGHEIHTAPLTAGGLTILQALSLLEALGWDTAPADVKRTQLQVEALRLAWRDRLTLLGDPSQAEVPVERLLSADHAKACADQIQAAVAQGRLLEHPVAARRHDGTIHLSAADAQGNLAALTLTHGNGFGARVTAPGLGLTFGHGMSRFDPDPKHPNAPGSGKRPLHNMCPTVVTRHGVPVLAVGGRGGRKIPNAVLDVLAQVVCRAQDLAQAAKAPRLHTEGGRSVAFEPGWPAAEVRALAGLGYQTTTAASATISAVWFDPKDGRTWPAMR